METKRRIGVTSWEDVPPEALARYHARVREAGADVIALAEAVAGREPDLVATLDGLLLTGGVDVDPDIYGATERHAKVKETSRDRDRMELAALDAALARDIPVLAICRGHQLMNVGFGGTLVQHIDSGDHRADYRTEGYPSRWHDVRIAADSRLATAMSATSLEINSRHHQAVTAADLGAGLRPVAWAADHAGELIEGAESEQHRWVVSVQWHPERLEEHKPPFAPSMRRLFDAFIREAEPERG